MAEIGTKRKTRSVTLEAKRRRTETVNATDMDFDTSTAQHGETSFAPIPGETTAQAKAAQPTKKDKKKTAGEAKKGVKAKKKATQTGEKPSSASRKGSKSIAVKRKGSSNGMDQQVQKKTRKCSTKAMKKSDREALLRSLKGIEVNILLCDVINELRTTFDDDNLMKDFIDTLCSSDQLLQEIIVHHQHCFGALYVSSKTEQDAFTHFQFEWYKHCSAFLLSEKHSLEDINYQELEEYPVTILRGKWLDFAKENGIPVPDCNQVMMTLSSAVYLFLLDHVARFQRRLIEPENVVVATDYDDVYFRFGGATLCSMLHTLYKQIKDCSEDQRNILLQKITILQAVNTKDKSCIPGYLKYRDRGYMYFPDPIFIPYLREVDTILKQVVNSKGLNEHGADLIKVLPCPCCTVMYTLLFYRWHIT